MKRFLVCAVAAVLVCGVAVSGAVVAQESPPETGELTVPWTEFKRLVNLDEDEVVLSMETFRKLVAQTGVETTPPHTVNDGSVVLSRDQFRSLVNRMRAPEKQSATPPFEYLITKAIYAGEMHSDNTAFRVFREPR